MKTLKDVSDTWTSSLGVHLTLCVLCELVPNSKESTQAIVVYHGNSLCREHLEQTFARSSAIDVMNETTELSE